MDGMPAQAGPMPGAVRQDCGVGGCQPAPGWGNNGTSGGLYSLLTEGRFGMTGGLDRQTIDLACSETLMRTIVERIPDDANRDRPTLSGEYIGELSEVVPWLAARGWFEADLMTQVLSRKDGGAATLPVTMQPTEQVFTVTGGVPVDVVNNAGSVVLRAGYGVDRGFQDIDTGQFDAPADVFALCGCAVALRTEAGRDLDWFDDDFFLYYEDTDLSWRLRAAGWDIRYEPTAVVRHVHAATSVEWSPTKVFHTDRNRLLMLVKNATARMVLQEVGRYPLTTGSMALRTVRTATRAGRRPAVRPTVLRLRVLASFLRLLPSMLAKRSRGARAVPRRELEKWLAPAG